MHGIKTHLIKIKNFVRKMLLTQAYQIFYEYSLRCWMWYF